MNKALTLKDYQLISTYLDERCSPREQTLVSSRLATDAEYQALLAEFARTKKMLASLPKVKSPHNFTLSAAQVPAKPRRFFLVPALNFVAMAAVAALVIIFTGSRLLPSFSANQAFQSAAPVMESASDAATYSATSIPMIIWGQPAGAFGMGGKGGGSASVPLQMGGGAERNPAPLSKSPETAPAPLTTTADSNPSNLIMGLADPAIQGEVIYSSASTPLEEGASAPPLSPLVIAEISLGSLALLSVLTAWFLKRRR